MSDDGMDFAINISADGSAAISGLNDVSDAAESMGDTFQHAGVHVFGEELAHMAGITGNLRPVMMALQASVSGLVQSFGLGASAIFPYVAILGGLAAIIYKVTSAHKESSAAMMEHINAATADADATAKYTTATGALGKSFKELHDAQVEVQKTQLTADIAKMEAKFADLNQVVTNSWSEWNKQAQVTMHASAEYKKMVAQLELAKSELASLTKTGSTYEAQQQKNTEETKKFAEEQEKVGEAISTRAKLELDEYNKMHSAIEKYQQDQAKAAQQEAQASAQAWMSFSTSITGHVGNAFAKSIVEGQKFGLAMKSVFQNLEEKAISAFLDMAAKGATMWALQHAGALTAEGSTTAFAGSLTAATSAATALKAALLGIP